MSDHAKRRQDRLDRLAAISKIGQDAAAPIAPPAPPVPVVPEEEPKPRQKPPIGLEQFLQENKANNAARAEWAAGRAAEQERLAPFWAEFERLPQSERRRGLDEMGLHKHSAAPRPIEFLRGSGHMPRLHKAPEPVPQEVAGLAKPVPALEQAPKAAAVVTQAAPAKGEPVAAQPWQELARKRATEIIERQRRLDLYPSQNEIADEIAKAFRVNEIFGEGGKPITGAYIKRHALKGVSSEQGRQLSTGIHRGK